MSVCEASGIEIISAGLEDADTVGMIISASWQSGYKDIVQDEFLRKVTPEFRAERFRTVLPKLKEVEFYIVYVERQPAGVFCLQCCRDEDAADAGEIGVFYFLREFWGRGPAFAAMRFALGRLAERGFHEAVLWVLEDNPRARRFYQKHGFVPDGARKTINLGKDLFDIRCRREL